MKLFKKAEFISLILVLLVASSAAYAAQSAVILGTTAPFAILAGTAISDVPASVITGNVGLSPAAGTNITGLTQAQVAGTTYSVDGTGPPGTVNNPGLLTTAKNDLITAYNDAAGRTPVTPLAGGLLVGTLTPGVYSLSGPPSNLVTTVTLDAGGDPNAVFIFQASSTLITSPGSSVILAGGAQACNVFWQVTSSATLDTTTHFIGTIMALTSATLNTGATLNGRVLARNGAVSLDHNTITVPACAAGTIGGPELVTTPGLPNTGTGPQQKSIPWWSFPTAILATSSTIYLIRREHKLSSDR